MGKQLWGGGSKAATAAQWKEVEEEAHSYRQTYRKQQKQQQQWSVNNSSKNGGNSNKSETTRPTLKSVSLLRSLLTERRAEDRWSNRHQRRRLRHDQQQSLHRPVYSSS